MTNGKVYHCIYNFFYNLQVFCCLSLCDFIDDKKIYIDSIGLINLIKSIN